MSQSYLYDCESPITHTPLHGAAVSFVTTFSTKELSRIVNIIKSVHRLLFFVTRSLLLYCENVDIFNDPVYENAP